MLILQVGRLLLSATTINSVFTGASGYVAAESVSIGNLTVNDQVFGRQQ